ncbi:hypothetical protein CONPUDRAFT_126538 [Coniophora puteana RWD-64-598 SS2]|uniref:Uncharacterized protein n=1 Tax=Coniophora puteana (strain RWD-64-598) TaxID=741705 RepID=A0A5M3MI47_CONPW|nr:uncharacterized protein CONPUDRAFT_126538 [Coniophora puteana RWD-64-598 SS2]EIW78763.1 hypothetical protein CONPUDRAFT_126538 [Coniophora puteana RWD-64-598 SS2]
MRNNRTPLIAQFDSTFVSPGPQQTEELRAVFVKMTSIHEDADVILDLVGTLCQDLRALRDEVGLKNLPFAPFALACIEADVVPTMTELSRREWYGTSTPNAVYMAQFWALESLSSLMAMGDVSERRSLVQALLQEGALDVCVKNLRHEFCFLHQNAATTLHNFAFASILGETIPPSKAADVIEAVCVFALQGPEETIAQMHDPETSWQRAMFMDKKNETPKKVEDFPPHFYALTVDNAMFAAHAVLCTFPPQSRQFCLAILKEKPHIIDLLLDCAILDRPEHYPQSKASMYACRTLLLLFALPSHAIPGVTKPDKKSREWKAFSQALTILTSRTDWLERLIEVWMHVEEEDKDHVAMYIHESVREGSTGVDPYERDSLWNVSKTRVECLASTLQLIDILTHNAESCGISNAQIESLLHIAYQGCVKCSKPLNECKTADEAVWALELDKDIYDTPHLMNPSGSMPTETPFSVPPRETIGPIALVRLIVVLAQRKALDGIQTLLKPPNGLTSSTSLAHIQHITHPDMICRIIKLSLTRILERIEDAREHLASKKDAHCFNTVCMKFLSAAELAAALIALDDNTDGRYTAEIRGARKQLVIALGNAAQMALNLKHYQRALGYATSAVAATERIPPEEGLSSEVIERNKRRFIQASAGLQRPR